jgi:hypothetical protein
MTAPVTPFPPLAQRLRHHGPDVIVIRADPDRTGTEALVVHDMADTIGGISIRFSQTLGGARLTPEDAFLLGSWLLSKSAPLLYPAPDLGIPISDPVIGIPISDQDAAEAR